MRIKAVFWVSPWPMDGNLNHFRNAVRKHLIPQANTLSRRAERVSFVLPAQLSDLSDLLAPAIDVVVLPLDASKVRAPSGDVHLELYENPTGKFAAEQADMLRNLLPDKADVVLLWETPAQFLRFIWPDVLIINQMPGIFSRPPYPHTVTFDPTGLYRYGTLHRHANDVQRGTGIDSAQRQITNDFSNKVQEVMRLFRDVALPIMERIEAFDEVALLPLQTSAHYAFRRDVGHASQTDLVWDALETMPRNTGLLVTQYRSGLVSETPIDDDLAEVFTEAHPNFIFDSRIDTIDSVSQYLLQHVDEVVTASSSLGLQAMVWNTRLQVKGETFLTSYATDHQAYRDIPWSERCQNTLSVLLNRLNPLAAAVVEDEAFLYGLIEQILARRIAGKTGLELLPSFREIDPAYEARLMNSFRVDRAARILSTKIEPAPEAEQLRRFRELVSHEDTRAISFDVFDTIIRRPFEKPADLWKFMEREALRLTGGMAVDFAKARGACEMESRARLADKQDEINIDLIYDTLADFYGIPGHVLEPVKQREIEREIASVRPRPFGRKLFEIARETGKPIYLISDMYLSQEVVEAMLRRTGYVGQYKELFLSSALGCRKHSGKLFALVLQKLDLQGKNLVHVGDNKTTDVLRAEEHGIRPFRWSSAIDWMRSNPRFAEVYPPLSGFGEKARSALAGTTAYGLFDAPVGEDELASISGGEPFRLGYAVLGPLFTGYMMWLLREARRDDVTDLFFMAREGWVLKEVFDALTKDMQGVPATHYLLGSRRAIRVAACRSEADVWALVAQPYDPGVAISDLIEGRFGIALQGKDLALLNDTDLQHLDQPLGRESEDRRLLNAVISKLMKRILVNAESERAAYMAYLRKTGLLSSERPGVVDIGWKANIQGALGDLIGRRTHGYYYATLPGAELWEAKGDCHRAYAGLSHHKTTRSAPVLFRQLTEFLSCHCSRSLVAMTGSDGDMSPVFRKEVGFKSRSALVRPIQNGAVQFARDFQDGFGDDIGQMIIDPSLAEAALASLLHKPSAIDARMFVGQGFEDAVGGIFRKFIISPSPRDPETRSVWPQGHRVIHAQAIRPGSKALTNKTEAAASAIMDPLKRRESLAAVARRILLRSRQTGPCRQYAGSRISSYGERYRKRNTENILVRGRPFLTTLVARWFGFTAVSWREVCIDGIS